MIATGQLILGTDKRNALFTVYEWEEDEGEEQLHVYYGLELLEVVPADRNAPSFKMLVGRLYNAGLSRRVLQETFRQTSVKAGFLAIEKRRSNSVEICLVR